MPRRAGSADLPLHGGRAPKWLGERMTRLGAVIVEAIVIEYGRDELLRRLAHPFWFQSFGAVIGMDWHATFYLEFSAISLTFWRSMSRLCRLYSSHSVVS
jgi:hypothetical protein